MKKVLALTVLLAGTCSLLIWAHPVLSDYLPAPAPRTSVPEVKLDPEQINPAATRIEIDKGDYELALFEGDQLLKRYPVVLGPNPTDDKKQEGDGCTPEGKFKIQSKYPHAKWSHFLWIDYPNAESWKKFEARKKRGEISREASIGGEIGIHGVPSGGDYMIGKQINWTLGCISLRNADIQEIYPLVQVGTEVQIRK